jgi:hypothetical protein
MRGKRVREAAWGERGWAEETSRLVLYSALAASTVAATRTWWALLGYVGSAALFVASVEIVRRVTLARAELGIVRAQKHIEDQISVFKADQFDRPSLEGLHELPHSSPKMLALGYVHANFGDPAEGPVRFDPSFLESLPSLDSVRRLSDGH